MKRFIVDLLYEKQGATSERSFAIQARDIHAAVDLAVRRASALPDIRYMIAGGATEIQPEPELRRRHDHI